MQIVFARVSCSTHLLLAVLLRLQVVREDHFGKVSSDQLSGGPTMSSGALEHAWCHSGGRWLTSVREVHWGHVSAIGPWAHALVLSPVDRILAM